MSTYLKVWISGPNATIVDMPNAGKRGKTCRKLRVSGRGHAAEEFIRCTLVYDIAGSKNANEVTSKGKILDIPFDSIAAACHTANLPGLNVYEEEIKGIEAPKPTLVAGNADWFGSVDENGISLGDLTDRNNEPRMITPSSQKNSAAYQKASKVWGAVEKAKTMSEAGSILTAAGCKLHYYCAMD